ncbi:thioesterase family protein [Mitsuaria sp. WAJ17]|uniref:acyl-CoA thioesterase n=1 Tax=Mitsuaria sp. WAJ17 TaxID=2761452 RepID=UPI0016040970|nr:thioesterase family protein [Mitsuaria sp. WAJ17]MBB2485694.1 thioesterase family protein [Mitsuaria sp. WAJ17]
MLKHTYLCPVRWSDMDVYGVVNNVSHLRLLEEARVDFIWRLGRQDGDAFFAGGSVVVSHEISYIAPLVHQHEPVPIDMWVSGIQAAVVTIECVIRCGQDVVSRATTRMAPYDYASRRPRRLTPQESAFFERYLHSEDEAVANAA